ncbi:MAG: hypothetical protein HC887_02010 [Desulfobacteraceae bacterium]|nr:hypothetical protein [Desulfobacteraceae bacterium]
MLNRLTSANNTQHKYDAARNRISTTRSGVETRYLLDLEPGLPDVMATLDSNNNVQEFFIHGPGGLLASIKNGQTRYVHQDFNHNVVAITDGTGAVKGAYAYTPMGRNAGSQGEDFAFKFAGGVGAMTDSEGLIYMRARYYHPGIRQFTSPDLMAGNLARPQSLARYAYVEGMALNGVDPSGAYVVGMNLKGVKPGSPEFNPLGQGNEALFNIFKHEVNIIAARNYSPRYVKDGILTPEAKLEQLVTSAKAAIESQDDSTSLYLDYQNQAKELSMSLFEEAAEKDPNLKKLTKWRRFLVFDDWWQRQVCGTDPQCSNKPSALAQPTQVTIPTTPEGAFVAGMKKGVSVAIKSGQNGISKTIIETGYEFGHPTSTMSEPGQAQTDMTNSVLQGFGMKKLDELTPYLDKALKF